MTNPENLRETLLGMADPAYRDFNARIIPGAGEMLGIRIPQLRQMARRIVRDDNWREFAVRDDCRFFEERMLQGMVIASARCPIDEKLPLVARFVPRIDNWALCDCFCWKLRTEEREPMWRFIQPYFRARAEYDVRFAVVMATANFIDEEHLDALFRHFEAFRHKAYYARMGVAWALSVCYVKFPERTLHWLREECPLDDWTFNKTIQKIGESFRVSPEGKAAARALKRNTK